MSEDPATNKAETADVGSQQVARVYAEALLNIASERNQEDEILGELDSIVGEIFASSPVLEEFFATKAIGQHKKSALIHETFKNRSSETLSNFLLVLNRQNRLGLLRPIRHAYRRLLEQRRKKIKVQATSAFPLSDDQVEKLRQTIQQTLEQEPEIEQQVDPALIGGLVIQVGDFRFDASVLTRVNNIRKRLIERSSHVYQIGRDHLPASGTDSGVSGGTDGQ